MAPATTRESAVELARRGMPIFPLAFRTKKPLERSNGLYDATADLTITRRRWAGRLHNVGVRTGLSIGPDGHLCVLDIDGEDGYRELARLEAEHGKMPRTFTVSSGRGEHQYLVGPVLQSRTGFLHGLDLKATGGYVVGPCSIHPSGAIYECRDWNAPIATMPAWLVDLVRRQEPDTPIANVTRIVHAERYLMAALEGEAQRLSQVTVDRNTSLFCAAVRLRRLIEQRSLPNISATIERELCAAAVQTGLSREEARKTIRSALTGGGHGS